MAKFLQNFKGRLLYTDRMEDAVAFAFVNTEKGKICLLSTASPSYSVWKNFEEKGNLYKQAIYDIAKSSLEK
jgi:UDP-N-acetylmuramoylalanine--D-glutamate ligase